MHWSWESILFLMWKTSAWPQFDLPAATFDWTVDIWIKQKSQFRFKNVFLFIQHHRPISVHLLASCQDHTQCMIGRHGSYPKLKSKYLIVPRVRKRKVYSFVTCLCSAALHLKMFTATFMSNRSGSTNLSREFIALLDLFTVPFLKDFCDQKCLILEALVFKI